MKQIPFVSSDKYDLLNTKLYRLQDIKKVYPDVHKKIDNDEGSGEIFIAESDGRVQAIYAESYTSDVIEGEKVEYYNIVFSCEGSKHQEEGIRHLWFEDNGYINYPYTNSISVGLMLIDHYINPRKSKAPEIIDMNAKEIVDGE